MGNKVPEKPSFGSSTPNLPSSTSKIDKRKERILQTKNKKDYERYVPTEITNLTEFESSSLFILSARNTKGGGGGGGPVVCFYDPLTRVEIGTFDGFRRLRKNFRSDVKTKVEIVGKYHRHGDKTLWVRGVKNIDFIRQMDRNCVVVAGDQFVGVMFLKVEQKMKSDDYVKGGKKWVSDRTVKVCDYDYKILHDDRVAGLCLIGRNKFATCAYHPDNSIIVWRVKKKTLEDGAVSVRLVQSRQLFGHSGSVLSVKYFYDDVLVSGGTDNGIRLWDYSEGKCLQALRDSKGTIYDFVCLEEDKIFFALCEDNAIRQFGLSKGRKETFFMKKVFFYNKHSDPILKMMFLEGNVFKNKHGNTSFVQQNAESEARVVVQDLKTNSVTIRKFGKLGNPITILEKSCPGGEISIKCVRDPLQIEDKYVVFSGNMKLRINQTDYGLIRSTLNRGKLKPEVKIFNSDGDILGKYKLSNIGQGKNNVFVALEVFKDTSLKKTKKSNKEKEERTSFVLENSKFDFKICLKNKNISCLKYLLAHHSYDHNFSFVKADFVKIDKELDVDEEQFLRLLFGYDNIRFEAKEFIEYFEFFKELKMYSHVFLLLQKLADRDFDNNTLLALFKTAIERFEVEWLKEKEVKSFESEYSAVLFRLLKRKIRKKSLKKDGNEMRFLKDKGISFILDFKRKEIQSMRIFTDVKKDVAISFGSLFQYTLDCMFGKRSFWNLLLNGSVQVHKEVLIFGSNFFYSMLKFGGIETGSGERVDILDLKANALKHFVEYFYLKKVNSADLGVLFSILKMSEMYFEAQLNGYILKKITEVVNDITESEFQEKIVKYGYLFQHFPYSVQKKLIRKWSRMFRYREHEIVTFIEHSIFHEREKQFLKRIKLLEDEVISLKKELEEKDLKIGFLMKEKDVSINKI